MARPSVFSVVRLAWLSLARNRARLALVVIPSAVLFALVALLLNVEYAMRGLDDGANHRRTLRVGAPFGQGYLSKADVEKIRRIPHVVDVGVEEWAAIHTVEAPGVDSNWAAAYNAHQVELFKSNIFYVPPDEIKRWDARRDNVIIGKLVAEKHHWKVGDLITLKLGEEEKPLQFHVTYIAERGEMLDVLEVHDGLVEDVTGKPTKILIAFTTVDDLANMPMVREQVADIFQGRPLESLGLTLADTLSYVHRRSDLMLSLFRGTGLLAALLVIGMTLTSLILSVEERRRELATLRAVGYRRGAILSMVIAEGILTVVPGALLGAAGVFFYFHDRVIQFGSWTRVTTNWKPSAVTALVAIALGLVGSILPALNVARLSVLAALRDD